MKFLQLSVAAASLLQLALAQPHGRQHHAVHKRTNVRVIVYVDQAGNVLSTVTDPVAAPTPAPQAEAQALPFVNHPGFPKKHTAVAPKPKPSPAPAPAPAAAPAAAPAPAPSSDLPQGHGLTYSPYAPGRCKTAEEIKQEWTKISGYSIVRLYGVDCDQISTVLPLAKAKGMKIFAGVDNPDTVSDDLAKLIAAGKSSWDAFDTIAIGNEWVNSGRASPEKAVSLLQQGKAQLKAAGYTGPVVSPDTFVAMIANPSICQNADYAAANCHPFFDGNVAAHGSGDFLLSQKKRVEAACGKKVVITETGWPKAGQTNNQAVPGIPQQKAALTSIQAAFTSNPQDVIMLTAFDDLWKDDGFLGTEKHWGILE